MVFVSPSEMAFQQRHPMHAAPRTGAPTISAEQRQHLLDDGVGRYGGISRRGGAALLCYALQHAVESHLPRSAGVSRRLPSLFDRAVVLSCPGHAMHPHDVRLVVLARHHHRRPIQVSVERQQESALVDVLPMPDRAPRLVADHAQAFTGIRHAAPPFDQHATPVLVRHGDGPDDMAGGIADQPIADHEIELMVLGARALPVQRLRGAEQHRGAQGQPYGAHDSDHRLPTLLVAVLVPALLAASMITAATARGCDNIGTWPEASFVMRALMRLAIASS